MAPAWQSAKRCCARAAAIGQRLRHSGTRRRHWIGAARPGHQPHRSARRRAWEEKKHGMTPVCAAPPRPSGPRRSSSASTLRCTWPWRGSSMSCPRRVHWRPLRPSDPCRRRLGPRRAPSPVWTNPRRATRCAGHRHGPTARLSACPTRRSIPSAVLRTAAGSLRPEVFARESTQSIHGLTRDALLHHRRMFLTTDRRKSRIPAAARER